MDGYSTERSMEGINVVKVMEAVILKNLNLNFCYVRIKNNNNKKIAINSIEHVWSPFSSTGTK